MKSQSLTKKSNGNDKIMEKKGKTILEEIQGTVDEILKQVRKLVREGNARRIIVKDKHGKVLFQSQLTIGAVGITFFTVMAPILTAISTLVLLVNDVRVLVEREVDENDDEYEVEAEIIEIEDDDEKDDDEEDSGSGKKKGGGKGSSKSKK